jgi:acetyl-CoA acetyltransferase
MPRTPMKDKVAIAGAATTGFVAFNSPRSQTSLVAEACTSAIRACGLRAEDIDGICGSMTIDATTIQSLLGIPEIGWFANVTAPIVNQLSAAMSAVHAGLCDVVLVYQGAYRLAWNTAKALEDPFRRSGEHDPWQPNSQIETMEGAVGYSSWAARYLYEYGPSREALGLIAINGRTNAGPNPAAAKRQPMTMDDYLSARMIRWPQCLLDMDVPVDGADAFIVTTAERARAMKLPPVYINSVTMGAVEHNIEDQTVSLHDQGQQVVVKRLKDRSDFWIDDIDLFYAYDGCTNITLSWIENAGFCGAGEGASFLRENWSESENRILIGGRVPVNTHGGALSEGGTQGSGHLREAVHQLQGLAGERQAENAKQALLLLGGYFYNCHGLTMRVD